MNGVEETTNSVGAPQISEEQPAVQSFKCKTCGREFGGALALQTHEIRAHRQFWSTNKKAGKKPKAKKWEATPAQKKSYYQKSRDRYHARGLNAHGQPFKRGPFNKADWARRKAKCPVCSKPYVKAYLSAHMRKKHGTTLTEFRNGQTLPARGSLTTCPVCSKTFRARPIMMHHLRVQHGRSITEFQGRGGRPLAISETEKATEDLKRHADYQNEKRMQAESRVRAVMFCPVCGTNIHNVQTAVNFGE